MDQSEMSAYKKILRSLKSNNTTEVYNCLIDIRTNYVKYMLKMRVLVEHGFLKIIISFLEHPKLCNVTLSIIANCSMDPVFRKAVIASDGIACLTRILKGMANDEIVNRACRAISNVALSAEGLAVVHKHKPVGHIVKFLTSTDDKNCIQTAIRCLRILGEDIERRNILVRENALLAISQQLSSEDVNVCRCSVKAMAVLTRGCSAAAAMQIQKGEALEAFKKLYYQFESDITDNALTCLENLACVPAISKELISVGALKIFVEIAKSCAPFNNVKSAALALCTLCRESMERSHIRNAGGLHVLLDIVKKRLFTDIHDNILFTVILLCSEVDDLGLLRNLGVMPMLLERLKVFVDMNKSSHSVRSSHNLQNCQLALCSEEVCKTDDVTLEVQTENDVEVKKIIKSDVEMLKLKESGSKSCNLDSKPNKIYSIHSPTYQGLQYSELCIPEASGANLHTSFQSPLSSARSNSSPDTYYFDWTPGSPVSCSSLLGPWSPNSSLDDNPDMCWSPVLSSRSLTPDSVTEEDSHIDDSIPDCNRNTEPNKMASVSTVNLSDSLQLQKALEKLQSQAAGGNSTPDCSSKTSSFERSCGNSLDKHVYSIELTEVSDVSNTLLLQKTIEQIQQTTVLSTAEDVASNTSSSTINPSKHFENMDESSVISESLARENILNKSASVSSGRCFSERSTSDISPLPNHKTKECSSDFEVNYSSTFGCNMKRKSPISEASDDRSLKLAKKPRYFITESSSDKTTKSKPEIPSNDISKRIDHHILLLLSHVVRQLKSTRDSAIVDGIDFSVLMEYLAALRSPNPRALRVLRNLISNHNAFEKLIIRDFVGQMDKIMVVSHDTECCMNCLELENSRDELLLTGRIMAETCFGVGTLEHVLLTSESVHQVRCLYAVGRLIRKKSLLHKLIIEADGLSALSECISSNSNAFFKSAAFTLSSLCCTLKGEFSAVKEEKVVETFYSCCQYSNKKYDAEFVLDDGAKVSAVRWELAGNSDYFRALLDGFYEESTQHTVKIPEISSQVFSVIMHFLHGCTKSSCPILNNMSLEDSIELLEACERFLLKDLKTTVEHFIAQDVKLESAAISYAAAKTVNSLELADVILNFVLCCGMHQKEDYILCLEDLLKSHGDDFLRDVESFFKKKFCDFPPEQRFSRRFSMKVEKGNRIRVGEKL